MRQTAAGTREVAQNILQVNDASAQTGRMAFELQGAAGSLKEHSDRLASEVGAFLKAASAA